MTNIKESDKCVICTPGNIKKHIFLVVILIKCLHFSGQRICLSDNQYIGGAGTYTRQGYITSCLAGVVKVTSQPDKVSG